MQATFLIVIPADTQRWNGRDCRNRSTDKNNKGKIVSAGYRGGGEGGRGVGCKGGDGGEK
jgi:hypothetical protein